MRRAKQKFIMLRQLLYLIKMENELKYFWAGEHLSMKEVKEAIYLVV